MKPSHFLYLVFGLMLSPWVYADETFSVNGLQIKIEQSKQYSSDFFATVYDGDKVIAKMDQSSYQESLRSAMAMVAAAQAGKGAPKIYLDPVNKYTKEDSIFVYDGKDMIGKFNFAARVNADKLIYALNQVAKASDAKQKMPTALQKCQTTLSHLQESLSDKNLSVTSQSTKALLNFIKHARSEIEASTDGATPIAK